ncbi:endonuclease/exonuclease/phosphatase family metal-dependent hydrolase [Paenisporosarcina sp. OV554]|nr:endonuclease/exonuclease/phosphatase family metal-dependent hydrolase [Paenisporosarcina sp. OV554]
MMTKYQRRKAVSFMLAVTCAIVALSGFGQNSFADETEFPRGESVDVKVMSYNIHHGEGTDRVLDLERIAQVIENSEADIIGLQEVDNHWSSRSNFEDQANTLAKRLGMFYVYAPNLDNAPLIEGEPRRQYGTAILSKYPILDSENHKLTKIGNTEQRGLLEATINVKGNQVHFYNTHLALTSAEREIQIREVNELAGQVKGPKIIMGDLNAKPESPEMQLMISNYSDAFADKPAAYTYSSINPTVRIDYIFTTDNIETVNAEVIRTLASDHLPVTAVIKLERNEPFNNGQK